MFIDNRLAAPAVAAACAGADVWGAHRLLWRGGCAVCRGRGALFDTTFLL